MEGDCSRLDARCLHGQGEGTSRDSGTRGGKMAGKSAATFSRAIAGRSSWRPWVWILLTCFVASTKSSSVNDCHSVRYAYLAKGLDLRDVPRQPRHGSQLEICPRGLTCCTEEMEKKLRSMSKEQYGKAVASEADSLRRFFSSRAGKFDGMFPELMARSKQEFHRLFRDTYGIIYIKNSDVFIHFFKDLEAYYDHGNVDLEEALKRFFTFLYQRMFKVYNHQFTFDARYLTCVSQTMKALQPFGDVPREVTEHLRRSFVATRAFSQALLQGKKIINEILKVQPKEECVVALTKMSSCPACEGLSEMRPCENYCVNVMKGCLAYHVELGTSWDKFIDNLQLLAERLLGPFNIEDVVDPIGIKISEAIMNFQRSGFDVTQKVQAECGTPRLEKREAADDERESFVRSIRRAKKNQRGRNNQRRKSKGSSKLTVLVREVRETVGRYKSFWSGLSHALCKDDAVGGGRKMDDDQCWNGQGAGRYTNTVVSDNLSLQGFNPEVEVDASRPDAAIQEQILTLRSLNKKLSHAIKGESVEWQAEAEDYHDYDEGSGDDGCDPNSDDEDCSYYNVPHEEGSGSGRDVYDDDDEKPPHYSRGEEADVKDEDYKNVVVPVDEGSENKSAIRPKESDVDGRDGEDEYYEYADNWPPWVTKSPDPDDDSDLTVVDTNDIDDRAQITEAGASTFSLAVIHCIVPFVACAFGRHWAVTIL